MSGRWVQVAPELTGRELDMAVAEHVIGWVRGPRWGNGNGPWIIDGTEGRSWESTPRYSTDMTAAMEVLEKMRADEYEVRITSFGVEDRAVWAVCFHKGYGDAFHGDSLPLLICRAALQVTSGSPSTTVE